MWYCNYMVDIISSVTVRMAVILVSWQPVVHFHGNQCRPGGYMLQSSIGPTWACNVDRSANARFHGKQFDWWITNVQHKTNRNLHGRVPFVLYYTFVNSFISYIMNSFISYIYEYHWMCNGSTIQDICSHNWSHFFGNRVCNNNWSVNLT